MTLFSIPSHRQILFKSRLKVCPELHIKVINFNDNRLLKKDESIAIRCGKILINFNVDFTRCFKKALAFVCLFVFASLRNEGKPGEMFYIGKQEQRKNFCCLLVSLSRSVFSSDDAGGLKGNCVNYASHNSAFFASTL
jgi:hypothetical protein